MSRRKNLVALDASNNSGSEQDAVDAAMELSSQDATADTAEDAEEAAVEEAPEALAPNVSEYQEAWDEAAPGRSFGWLVPALAILAIAVWTGFFGWIHQSEIFAGAQPQVWAGWIVDWAVPVLLVVALGILAMRNSTREAARFGETARLLSQESENLETRLLSVNRELSMARDFMASQARDLESLGRLAAERLSTNADQLQQLVRDNGDQVNAIGQVSDTALTNMGKLRDQLPVISNAARDVANQIGGAGNVAQTQLDDMVAGFERLNQFGQASEQQVETLRDNVSETLQAFEAQTAALETLSSERFVTLREQSEAFRVELESRETDTVAAIRRRAEELQAELAARSEETKKREDEAIGEIRSRLGELQSQGDALTASMREGQQETQGLWQTAIEGLQQRMADAIGEVSRIDQAAIESARNRLEDLKAVAERSDASISKSADTFETEFARRRELNAQRETEALSALEQRIASFDNQIGERQEEHLAHISGLAERGDALALRLKDLDRELARLSEQGRGESSKIAEATEALSSRLSQSRAILEESGTFVSHLTDDSVRLLEIIRASADHSEGALSNSIGKAETRLGEFQRQAAALHATIAEAESKGGMLNEHIGKTSQQSMASLETMEALETRLAGIAQQSSTVTEQARGELQSAIASLEEASGNMLGKLRMDQADAVREIAENIGARSSDAIDQALREGASAAIAELDEAARNAAERGRDTASQLRDQLAMVNELAGNLEQRVSHARERAEEQVDSDFTRRMALITESLNSCSIDIAKAFDLEVTDSAWASYLRGDRGIFTRRAVRLLDNHEARAVSEIYQEDSEFRETVNRYIHDFEAMLRSVLSTRDGNALAVTLLSSDMGKLYVALAQAIERLRN